METVDDPQRTLRPRPSDARRVYCTMCEHTEFVHGDHGDRRCLYSECRCGGFTLGSVSQIYVPLEDPALRSAS